MFYSQSTSMVMVITYIIKTDLRQELEDNI